MSQRIQNIEIKYKTMTNEKRHLELAVGRLRAVRHYGEFSFSNFNLRISIFEFQLKEEEEKAIR